MLMDRRRAIAFDADAETITCLRQAFPEWEIEATRGATTDSLERDWSPGTADLLILSAHDPVGDALGLCRGLRSQEGRAHTPIVVLVPCAQDPVVKAALEAGADACLVLPVHAKDLTRTVARIGAGNQPGRHTLGLDPAQRADPWQDEGGEA